MSRTTVTLNDELLKVAQRLLGTSGISDTVNTALTVAIRQARLAAFDVRRFEITDDDIATARADRSDSR
ncbi:MAG: type II toxin-antitoxin system VapB family antitoxin [Pseudonocardiaceae bacterium]